MKKATVEDWDSRNHNEHNKSEINLQQPASGVWGLNDQL